MIEEDHVVPIEARFPCSGKRDLSEDRFSAKRNISYHSTIHPSTSRVRFPFHCACNPLDQRALCRPVTRCISSSELGRNHSANLVEKGSVFLENRAMRVLQLHKIFKPDETLVQRDELRYGYVTPTSGCRPRWKLLE